MGQRCHRQDGIGGDADEQDAAVSSEVATGRRMNGVETPTRHSLPSRAAPRRRPGAGPRPSARASATTARYGDHRLTAFGPLDQAAVTSCVTFEGPVLTGCRADLVSVPDDIDVSALGALLDRDRGDGDRVGQGTAGSGGH